MDSNQTYCEVESMLTDSKMESQPSIETRVCLVGSTANDEELKQKLCDLKVPCLVSQTGEEYVDDGDPKYETIFVLDNFEGDLFENLRSHENRIISPHVINYVFSTKQSIPYMSRPLYCTCMLGLTICFLNYSKKEQLSALVNLCHKMGAVIRKEVNSKIGYVVAASSRGSKYQVAISLGATVMKESWIHKCWEERQRKTSFKATDDEFLLPNKFQPFDGCVLSFYGFPESEKLHMSEQAVKQGATVVDLQDVECTHLVVEQNCTGEVPNSWNAKMYIVLSEWFWGSIQIEAKARESIYLYEHPGSKKMLTRSSTTSSLLGTPLHRDLTSSRNSSGKLARKRLRNENSFAKTIQNESPRGILPSKRPSTDLSTCILDNSTSSILSQSPLKTASISTNQQNVKLSSDHHIKSSNCRQNRTFSVKEDQKRLRRKRKSNDFLRYSDNSRKSLIARNNLDSYEKSTEIGKSRSKVVDMTPRNLMSDFCEVDQSNSSPYTRSKLNNSTNNNSIYTSYHKSKSREELFEKDKEQKRASARFHVVTELLQTEKNYVQILHHIITIFQRPLEDPNQPGGAILAFEDVKRIFHPLPEIEAAHRLLSDELEKLIFDWDEQKTCVGDVISKYAKDFQRSYPPFVNFFEERVNLISSRESNSRFHAFLKINQAKRECGRQTLSELLINTVQRLPRIILLLQDIKKHTERENNKHADISKLDNAIKQFKEVTNHINENKRKTEEQQQIFGVFYQVDDCPPTLLSSHRQFVACVEVVSTDDNLCKKGESLTLFLFKDCVEIARHNKRSKYNSTKSPNIHVRHNSNTRPLKHVKLLSLSDIKHLVDCIDTDEYKHRIAFYCREPEDTQHHIYSFKVLFYTHENTPPLPKDIEDSESESEKGKLKILDVLPKYRATILFMAIDHSFVIKEKESDEDAVILDGSVKSEKKSSAFSKIKHAFSFNKTPKRVLARANGSDMKCRSPATLPRSSPTHKPSSLSIVGGSQLIVDDDPSISDLNLTGMPSTSGLTPSMSVTSLHGPFEESMVTRTSTTSLMQCDGFSTLTPKRFDSKRKSIKSKSKLKPAFSTMNLAGPRSEADITDFPAVPTPPRRRRFLKSSAVKAASVVLSRTSSLRRRVSKFESIV